MEPLLHAVAQQIALVIQAIAIVVVAIVSLQALVNISRAALASHGYREMRAIWLDYGRWLVVGLTFQLAADIVGTSFTPTWNEVGRLAAVAAIRTFLSYFLDRELEHTKQSQPAIGGIHRRTWVAAKSGASHEPDD